MPDAQSNPRPVIQVFTRSVYGAFKVYPADPEQGAHLLGLTNCKTLEHRHLQALEALGFTIQSVPDPKLPKVGG